MKLLLGKTKKASNLGCLFVSYINYYKNLPKGWLICPLYRLVKSIIAGGDKPLDFVKMKDDKHIYPVIANGIKNDGIIGYSSSFTVNQKVITISGRGTIGFPIIRDYYFTPIVRLLVLKLLESGPNDLLLSYFLSLKCTEGVGTSIQQLTVPMIDNILIEVPPIKEQDRICSKIYNLFKIVE